MPDSNLYVSGSYLVWGSRPYDAPGSGSIRFLGGASSDFAGQPVGRVWISSANNHLFYTDSGSQVRIVPGVPLGIPSSEPSGRIWIDQFACPTASADVNIQQLVWVNGGTTYGATSEKAYCAKGGRYYGTASIAFVDTAGNTASYFRLSMVTGSGGQEPLCSGIRVGVAVGGQRTLDYFTTTNCTGTSGSVFGFPNLQLPNTIDGSYVRTSSFQDIPPSASSYRFRSESMVFGARSTAVGATSETRTTGSNFCLNASNDFVVLQVNWAVGSCQQFPA